MESTASSRRTGLRSRRGQSTPLAMVGASVIVVLLLSGIVQVQQAPSTDRQRGIAPSQSDPFGLAFMPGMASPHTGAQAVSVATGLWSDPRTWGGKLPSAGEDVLVDMGTSVTYDMASSPDYGNIVVMGSLVFSRGLSTAVSFTNMTIMMGGYVEVGSASQPIPAGVTATLRLSAAKEGSAGIMVMNTGRLEIHGASLGQTFAKLVASAPAGATAVKVADALGWKAGDHIVITSTSLFAGETEENQVAYVSGTTIGLTKPLNYSHDGVAPARGEVADLTRNVVVTSLNQSVHAMGVMFMYGAKGSLSFAEFSHLGGLGRLGKYPIHFHHVQNSMRGSVVEGVSVWDSHNRFITIHNTDGITVKDSVGYLGVGHGFFLEDGTEENNTLVNDISISTLPGTIRPDDGGAAGFWVQNPMNNLTRDIAVSAYGSGFDFSIPDSAPEVIPFDLGNFQASLNQAASPTVLTITAFGNNEAHSNGGDGLHLYRLDQGNTQVYSVFSGFSAWRNDNVGVDVTASPSVIAHSLIFGNQFGGLSLDSYNMTIRGSTVFGEIPGVGRLLNSTNAYSERYMIQPIGLVSMATNLTITGSTFKGHVAQGNVASADIIIAQNTMEQFSVFVTDTALSSTHPLIFGYPLNGDSYVRVTKAGTGSFILYRYDTSHGPACGLDMSYLAMKCPLP